MNPITRHLRKCNGFTSFNNNDVMFLGSCGKAACNLVYFGGDIQDFECNMQNCTSRDYIKWSLDKIGFTLYNRFVHQFKDQHPHVWIIRPSKYTFETLASYPNFLSLNETGIPLYQENNISQRKAFNQLVHLLLNSAFQIQMEESDIQPNILEIPMRIVGFSKGCCVLTELFYELSTLANDELGGNEDFANRNIKQLCKNLTDIYWLDAGHSGYEHFWPIFTQYILKLNSSSCPKIHLAVTPYQITDSSRPGKSREFNQFLDVLKSKNISFVESKHFFDKMNTKNKHSERHLLLELHFEILNCFEF